MEEEEGWREADERGGAIVVVETDFITGEEEGWVLEWWSLWDQKSWLWV